MMLIMDHADPMKFITFVTSSFELCICLGLNSFGFRSLCFAKALHWLDYKSNTTSCNLINLKKLVNLVIYN